MLKYYKSNEKECLIYTFKYSKYMISINYETLLTCEEDNFEQRIFTNINDFEDTDDDMKMVVKYNAIVNLSQEMMAHQDRDVLTLMIHKLIFEIQYL